MTHPIPTTPAEKLAAGVLLTDCDVATIYGLAVQTVRNWRALGEGPRFVRVGSRAVRYRPADVEAFLAAGEVQP